MNEREMKAFLKRRLAHELSYISYPPDFPKITLARRARFEKVKEQIFNELYRSS